MESTLALTRLTLSTGAESAKAAPKAVAAIVGGAFAGYFGQLVGGLPVRR